MKKAHLPIENEDIWKEEHHQLFAKRKLLDGVVFHADFSEFWSVLEMEENSWAGNSVLVDVEAEQIWENVNASNVHELIV